MPDAAIRLLGVELYEESGIQVLAVNPETLRVTQATPSAAKLFGYDTLDGVLVGDLVPAYVKSHDALAAGFVEGARQGRRDASHQMGQRLLSGRRKDGLEFPAIIILKWGEIYAAKRVVATVIPVAEQENAGGRKLSGP